MTNRKALALLLDPEKADLNVLPITSEVHPDYIFVGGSTGGDTTAFVRALKSQITNYKPQIPIVLFPGNSSQFTPEADAVLFLSLLSGNNPEYLVSQQIKSARAIYDSQIDFVPTAYILIDGGVETSTMRVTGTKPLDPKDIDLIVDTCIAAELMGKTAIYLEAGSGALNPVSPEIIKSVREHTSVTLIVGGGIRTPEAMNAAYTAGADIVVIGNHFESHPEELKSFVHRTSSLRTSDDEKYMRLALAEAQKALAADEIPVGCVIVSQGQIIGRGHNLTETLSDVTAHAEIQAITAAAQTLGGKYLPDATLYVTVEPCVMCAGAIGWAQISRIVYGAPDPKRGYATYSPRAFHPKATVTSGILESECRALIQEFFKSKRS
ncbi:MAG: phosphoglycerol geranylgeranyltransferase [Paludibacteraceae bacterium]|nr:phosphoglycerol geranylgeranyltransferase [Paludibacteraceae bacterium]